MISQANPRATLESPYALVVGEAKVLPSKVFKRDTGGAPTTRVRVLILDPRYLEGRFLPIDAVKGYIEAGINRDEDPVRWEVVSAAACPGFGPALYESLMEYARRKGTPWVSPSTHKVSAQAQNVWRKFRARGDVKTRPLVSASVEGALGCCYSLSHPMPGYDDALDRGRKLASIIARRKKTTRAKARAELMNHGPWFFRSAYYRNFSGDACRELGDPVSMLGRLRRAIQR